MENANIGTALRGEGSRLKKLALVLAVILALMLGFAALFYYGGELEAEAHVAVARAADHPEAFEAVRAIVENGAAPQTFDGAPLGDVSRYLLVDVNIDLGNRGFFPVEWLDLRVEPAAGDVAVYSLAGEGGSIAPRTLDRVNLKLITAAAPDAARAVRIQYYVYGMKREIEVR